MNQAGYLFLVLTGILVVILAVLVYAAFRILKASRAVVRNVRAEGTETAFMAAAVEEAVGKLKLQERAMKARAEASERLSSEIIASMTSGLLVAAADGTVRTINPAGRLLLQLPDEEPDGHFREVLERAQPLADVLEECLTTERPIVRRTVALELHGERRSHLGVTVSPIREQNGTVQGAICLFSDLSEVVELEEQLRLKDSLARVGELTAGIAHEFRNGLATIHGYSRLIAPERLPPDYRPYVAGIREETEALGQVVTNFLNFAKPAELVLAPVDIRGVIERAADDVRSEVTGRGGNVEIRGAFGRVDGDEVMLRQAFSNLCRNALEACVDAGVPPRIVIEGTADRLAGVQRLTVTDNGPGISERISGRMFRPFVTTKARGTGLGLALVLKIIVTHNGRVSATNAEAGGALLVVTLPLKPGSISDL
jgi:signal transduction histidine kinase